MPPSRPRPAPAPVSPLDAALQRVGDRWTLLVVEALLAGPQRFGELEARITGLAPNILSKRLKALEADGVIVAAPYSQRPYRVVYALSASGLELAGALRLLAQWGGERSPGGAGVRHDTCGTSVEARWWCPTCARTVDDDEAPDLDFV